MPMEACDVLIFSSHSAHRSEENDIDKTRVSLHATFHGKSYGLHLRQKYYVHRRANFLLDHGMQSSHFFYLSFLFMMVATDPFSNTIKLDPGKGYSQAFKTYGSAGPFSKIGDAAPVTVCFSRISRLINRRDHHVRS